MARENNVVKFPDHLQLQKAVMENWMERLQFERDARSGRLGDKDIVAGEARLSTDLLRIAERFNL